MADDYEQELRRKKGKQHAEEGGSSLGKQPCMAAGSGVLLPLFPAPPTKTWDVYPQAKNAHDVLRIGHGEPTTEERVVIENPLWWHSTFRRMQVEKRPAQRSADRQEADQGEGDSRGRKKMKLPMQKGTTTSASSSNENPVVSQERKYHLAKQLGIHPQQAEAFLQNKPRSKLKQVEMEIENLQHSINALTQENQALRKQYFQPHNPIAAQPFYTNQPLFGAYMSGNHANPGEISSGSWNGPSPPMPSSCFTNPPLRPLPVHPALRGQPSAFMNRTS